MKNINIFGNVGKMPETRTTQSGKQVTGFSVAVQDGWGDSKKTIWFDVSFWGKRGEVIAQHVSKGDKISVCGDLSTREYDGKTYLTINATDFTFGGKSGDSEPQSSYKQNAPDDDQIPF